MNDFRQKRGRFIHGVDDIFIHEHELRQMFAYILQLMNEDGETSIKNKCSRCKEKDIDDDDRKTFAYFEIIQFQNNRVEQITNECCNDEGGQDASDKKKQYFVYREQFDEQKK